MFTASYYSHNIKRKRVNNKASVTATINRFLFILCCFSLIFLPKLSLRQQQKQISNDNNDRSNSIGALFFTFVQALDDDDDTEDDLAEQIQQQPSSSATIQTKASHEKSTTRSRRQIVKDRRNMAKSNTSTTTATKESAPIKDLFVRAAVKGLGGGLPGAVAGFIQVLTLMWIRTVVNYQYRYAVTFRQAFAALKAEGGITRFYRGLGFALIQNPLAKFGATAANDMVDVFIERYPWVGQGRRAVISSVMVALWRFLLMPIDTCKTVLQVDSKEGFRELMRKVRSGKLYLLYEGAIASALSSSLSNWPWFYVYRKLTLLCQNRNYLGDYNLLRNSIIGFIASVVSDTTTNVFRVIKTNKQSLARKRSVGYGEAIREILAVDGLKGLFGRGLTSKLLANAIQSVVFTVVWRWLAERWNPTTTAKNESIKSVKFNQEEAKQEIDAKLKNS
jgi:hypothetical protein